MGEGRVQGNEIKKWETGMQNEKCKVKNVN
jgi:hypothetical protein